MTADIESRAPFKGGAVKTLVVFYSRTGGTRTLARAIADALDADIEQLVIVGEKPGHRGYLQCALDGILRRHVDIALPAHNPNDYDVVVIATPVWSGSVSSPVRTYLAAQDGRLRRVAFAVTAGGGSARRIYTELRRLTGLTPIATLAIPESELADKSYLDRVEQFAGGIPLHVHGPLPLPRAEQGSRAMPA